MTELVEIGRYPTQAQAEQGALVLAAIGISSRVEPFGNAMALMVSVAHSERARWELASFEHENRHDDRHRAPPARIDIWSVETALAYIAVLLFVFAADSKGIFSLHWQQLGAARAGLIIDGAWWRTVTALTLHTDSVHLFGNLAAGIIFAVLLSHSLGAGVAWLAIVVAGAFGNGLNAVFQPAAHLSIGASTAVFGGLGVLAGTALKARASMRWRGSLRRWTPIAGGIMLLAFFGMGGERTDIWAHVAGFVVGTGLGYALAHVNPETLRPRRVQGASAAAALGIIVVAWAIALSG